MQNVTVIGTGYVGLVLGAGLAELGNRVFCADIDEAKIEKLRRGIIPIYEPDLAPLVLRNAAAGRLQFTTDVASGVRDSEIVFIAVGTPPGEDGSADLSHVLSVARTIGQSMTGETVVVDKSTVPVGTAQRVREIIESLTTHRVHVCSNPEFLKEGAAVPDFFNGDRVVIGADSDFARERLEALYRPLAQSGTRIIHMDVASAEISKYAANAMLALRISFMNMIAQLSEAVGADVEAVREGVGSDSRIGPAFLRAGCGYGGSCFPKDVKALIRTLDENGIPAGLLAETIAVNEVQKGWATRRLEEHLGSDWSGHTIALWGLAFKPGTDDMREATSLRIVEDALARGATVRAHDPVAMDVARSQHFGDRIEYCSDALDAAVGASAVILVTEWTEYSGVDLKVIRNAMRGSLLLDGRNLYDGPIVKAAGLQHIPVGRPIC